MVSPSISVCPDYACTQGKGKIEVVDASCRTGEAACRFLYRVSGGPVKSAANIYGNHGHD
jgi:hypothetical protein